MTTNDPKKPLNDRKKAQKATKSREKGETAKEPKPNDDALSWYFNRSVTQPWDRILEVEDCIQQEIYTYIDSYITFINHSDF